MQLKELVTFCLLVNETILFTLNTCYFNYAGYNLNKLLKNVYIFN